MVVEEPVLEQSIIEKLRSEIFSSKNSDRENEDLVLAAMVAEITLADMVIAQGRLPLLQAVTLLYQVCKSLSLGHEIGIVHRDVRPENILITDEGHAQLKGSAYAHLPRRGYTPDLTVAGIKLHSLYFAAPEQGPNSSRITPAADIYSVGANFLRRYYWTLLPAVSGSQK